MPNGNVPVAPQLTLASAIVAGVLHGKLSDIEIVRLGPGDEELVWAKRVGDSSNSQKGMYHPLIQGGTQIRAVKCGSVPIYIYIHIYGETPCLYHIVIDFQVFHFFLPE